MKPMHLVLIGGGGYIVAKIVKSALSNWLGIKLG